MDERDLPALVAVCLVLAVLAVYAGLHLRPLEGPDGPDGPDVPPGDAIQLEAGRTTQTYPLWTTEFTVAGFRGEPAYPLENLTIEVAREDSAPFEDVVITFQDLDADGNASLGDVVLITNMTDEVNGAVLSIYRDEERVAREGVSWDVDDPTIYSAFLYWNYPVEENGSRWDTNFSVTHLALPFDVAPADLSFDVVAGTGEPLDGATVVFEDRREAGVLDDFDRVHLLGMTGDYQRAVVRMRLDGTVVAMGTVPQWIF